MTDLCEDNKENEASSQNEVSNTVKFAILCDFIYRGLGNSQEYPESRTNRYNVSAKIREN